MPLSVFFSLLQSESNPLQLANLIVLKAKGPRCQALPGGEAAEAEALGWSGAAVLEAVGLRACGRARGGVRERAGLRAAAGGHLRGPQTRRASPWRGLALLCRWC